MKSTLGTRSTANPRRTKLSHLGEAESRAETGRTPSQEHQVELPARTANPRRTVLMEAPAE